MLSRIECGEDELRGLAILGNINAKNTRKNIQNHALQEETRSHG
jgi:hypothetical protein